jgi:large conductance mechanosensitive channel
MIKGFGQFVMRGNVVDLAVAVVIGAAFGAVVSAFVKDLVTPLIAAIFGKPDFSALVFTVNGSKFAIGDFINALVAFVLAAAAIYFFVVAPLNAVTERFKKPVEEPPALRECPECLSDIPAAAARCKFCTATVTPASGPARG